MNASVCLENVSERQLFCFILPSVSFHFFTHIIINGVEFLHLSILFSLFWHSDNRPISKIIHNKFNNCRGKKCSSAFDRFLDESLLNRSTFPNSFLLFSIDSIRRILIIWFDCFHISSNWFLFRFDFCSFIYSFRFDLCVCVCACLGLEYRYSDRNFEMQDCFDLVSISQSSIQFKFIASLTVVAFGKWT